MRIIGDVHGKFDQYLSIIEGLDHSIQIGDFGFREEHEKKVALGQPNHKILFGNHDDYTYVDRDYSLGNIMFPQIDGIGCLSIRGANSIDRGYRTIGISWWPQEELPLQESTDLLIREQHRKVDILFSHDGPQDFIFEKFGYSPSVTRLLVDVALMLYKPSLCIFGHHHVSMDEWHNGTRMICLNELEYLDLTEEFYEDHLKQAEILFAP